jgi:hypothetical protein
MKYVTVALQVDPAIVPDLRHYAHFLNVNPRSKIKDEMAHALAAEIKCVIARDTSFQRWKNTSLVKQNPTPRKATKAAKKPSRIASQR